MLNLCVYSIFTSSRPEVFLGKGLLKMSSKLTGEYACRNVISIKLLCNFIEITLRHACSPVSLLHIFRIPFLKNTSGRLLVNIIRKTLVKVSLTLNQVAPCLAFLLLNVICQIQQKSWLSQKSTLVNSKKVARKYNEKIKSNCFL